MPARRTLAWLTNLRSHEAQGMKPL